MNYKQNKYIDIIEKLKSCIDVLYELIKFENLSRSNSAKTRKIGKQLDKYTKALISDVIGIEQYKKLLSSDNYNYKWNAALNLFPLFPNKCLIAMKESFSQCNDYLSKNNKKNVIDEYKKNLSDKNVFFERLRKLYNTEDLNTLSLE